MELVASIRLFSESARSCIPHPPKPQTHTCFAPANAQSPQCDHQTARQIPLEQIGGSLPPLWNFSEGDPYLDTDGFRLPILNLHPKGCRTCRRRHVLLPWVSIEIR